MRSRMQDDGMEEWDVAWARARAAKAEDHFIAVTGARRATEAENIAGWDCVLDGERIDVKSIEPHHAYVLGTSSPQRPTVRFAVVEVDETGHERIVGYVLGFQLEWGAPFGTRPCWYAKRSQIVASPTWTALESAWRRRIDEETR